MSYHFTKGHYRAYVSTRYYDHNDQVQYVNGDPVEFDADPVEYFEFETNDNIKVNLSTMEAPEGITLLEEGDDHGIHYKLYENSLAILTGTQTSDFGEEGWPAWCESDYIYASIEIKSGWVFKTSDSEELQIWNSSFLPGSKSDHLFNHGGMGWQVLNIGSLDTSNLTDFSYMLENLRVTTSFKGLGDLDFSNGTNFEGFMKNAQFQTQRHAIVLHLDNRSIDPTGTNHKFDYAFSGTVCEEDYGEWPYGLFIYLTAINNKTMFQWSEDMSCDFSYGKLRVYMENQDGNSNMPVDSSYMFYRNKNNGIYLSGWRAPANCDMSHFFEDTRAQYIYFKTETGSDESQSTRLATNMTALCKNNSRLYEVPRSLSMENCEIADEMYYGCSTLGYSSSSYSSTYVSSGGNKLKSAKKMFYNALSNWGSRATMMDLYLSVSMTDNVDLSELLTGAGIGYRGAFSFYLSGSGSNHGTGKVVSLNKAFNGISIRHINLYVHRDMTGEEYMMDVNLNELAKDSVLQSAYLYNLYIVNATDAFVNCTSLERLTFFDENMGGTPKSYCKVADSGANIGGMLIMSPSNSHLTQVYTPDNMMDKAGYESLNFITGPKMMKYYKDGEWRGNAQTTIWHSLVMHSSEYPTE